MARSAHRLFIYEILNSHPEQFEIVRSFPSVTDWSVRTGVMLLTQALFSYFMDDPRVYFDNDFGKQRCVRVPFLRIDALLGKSTALHCGHGQGILFWPLDPDTCRVGAQARIMLCLEYLPLTILDTWSSADRRKRSAIAAAASSSRSCAFRTS